jgi:hypothetical protein
MGAILTGHLWFRVLIYSLPGRRLKDGVTCLTYRESFYAFMSLGGWIQQLLVCHVNEMEPLESTRVYMLHTRVLLSLLLHSCLILQKQR